MLKKLSVILFLALFVFGLTAVAENVTKHEYLTTKSKPGPAAKLIADQEEMQTIGTYKPYFGQSIGQTFAPSRQLYNTTITIRDMWHNTACGRQIVYAGYYNSGCDYVYMNFPDYQVQGSTELRNVKEAIFDWAGGTWDFTVGGLATIGVQPSYYPNMGADPKNGYGVAAYHSFPTNSGWSYVGYAGACPSDMYNFAEDSLPGPPNTGNVQTGNCGDIDAESTPYIWPHMDVDTNSAGEVVVHIACNESYPAQPGDCGDVPGIETSTNVYYRKVGSNAWEGPVFMDSAYLISQLVVADKNSSDVYYCYLKPLYYNTGPLDPCDPQGEFGGYYQLGQEIVYRKSTDDGASWGPITYVTDYKSGYDDQLTDPANYDLSAMVDPDGNLHLVWFSRDRGTPDNPDDDECSIYYRGKLWHYDTNNDCISVAYDASSPQFFSGLFPTFHTAVTKPNVSWCDDKLYISFMRYGANPVGDTSFEVGAGNPSEDTVYQVADIMVVGSDLATGDMGKTWTEGINLTQTTVDSCLPGDCFHEVWPTMAPYSTDSLMLVYLEDKDPGMYYSREEGLQTESPVMFMTWPCFTMAEVGSNAALAVTPSDPTYPEIGLAPNGNTSGCTTPASFSAEVELNNSGNVGLNYTTSSNAGWLSVTFGTSGPINAGAGPRYSNNPAWTGAPGCASPATIEWTASSASLGQGNYSGAITVDIDDASIDDFDISVNLVVACEYYLPEFATVTGGCWDIDLYNTPQAGSGGDNDDLGNMTYYSCGQDSTLHPLYTEALIVGWKVGADLFVYTDNSDTHMGDLLPASLPEYQRRNARMRALSGVTVTDNTDPVGGTGYYQTEGYFCTPDSVLYGKAEYFVPFNQDTAVVIEKVTLWNESATTLTEALIGEGIDWDMEKDSNFDAGGFDPGRQLIFQYGGGAQSNIYAGLAPYDGQDANYGGAVLDNPAWIYPDTGYNIIDIYDKLTSLDGTYEVFSDSNTDLNTVFRFWEGEIAPDDTITICKVKAISLSGE
ncbi:MAG: hypothetical protein GF310_05700, partial [candidate division Zixibacteria bacterium]|nr:hypothetical protein [candidate division Zixibacteria bacterium]